MSPDEDELELRLQLALDPVRNFKPRPTQTRCYTSKARYRWCGGANRCLGGEQEIYDPVLDRYRRVDSITDDFHVLAWDGSELVAARALKPFTKKPGQLCRYGLSNGQSFVASPTHLVLTKMGDYAPLSELPLGSELFLPASTWGTFQPAHVASVRRFPKTAQDSLFGYPAYSHLYGEQPRSFLRDAQAFVPLPSDAPTHTYREHSDAPGCKAEHNHFYQYSFPLSIPDVQGHHVDRCAASLSSGVYRASLRASGSNPSSLRLFDVGSFDSQLIHGIVSPRQETVQKCHDQEEARKCYSERTTSRPVCTSNQQPGQFSGETALLSQDGVSNQELREKQISAAGPLDTSVALISMEYIRDDVKWDFTVPIYHNYLCGGIIHHNSGKSAILAIEAAAAARRLHPTRSVNKPTVGLILAPSREQLQDPWEKKLLRDCELTTHGGRPLIPEQEIKKVYRTHGAGAPTLRQIDLKNGNTIRFGVSKDPESWKRRAGQQLAWIILDEAEGNMNLLNELYPRLLDANKDPEIVEQAGGGWLLWGATPTTANVALMKFIADCEDPKLEDWQAFRFNDGDGDATDLAERERLRPAFADEDFELRMKGSVNFVDRLLIYGRQWNDSRHMRTADYEIQPDDNLWCAYDPGGAGKESHDTGILFAAINKSEPRKLHFVKYIKLNRTTLNYDVKVMADYLRGRKLEGFVPDPAVAKTEKGSGKTVRQQLMEELIKEKILVRRGLIHIHNWHDPGIKRCQTYLEQGLIDVNPSYDSGGQLFRQQMVSYRSYEAGVYQGIRGVVKTDDEAPDCARYLIQAKPIWMPVGCGGPAWEGPTKPLPPPPPPAPVLTEDQINYQAQLARSQRLAAPSQRRRFRN